MDSPPAERGAALAFLILLVCAAAVGGVATAESAVAVTDVAHSGDAVVGRVSGQPQVVSWRPHDVSVTVEGEASGATVCLRSPNASDADNGSRAALACEAVSTGEPPAVTNVTVPAGAWAGTGARSVDVVVSDANGTELARTTTSVHVLGPTGDADGDGLANRVEADVGTGITQSDTDGDGLSDGDEHNVHDTDPLDPDTDGDGLADGVELEEGTNPTRSDTDDDGLSDATEVTTLGTDPTSPDTDGDGVPDGRERELALDPTERDSDGDGLPDGEELRVHETLANRSDTDGDGLDDGREVRLGTNPNATDTDGDGLPDRREVAAGTDPTSVDSDGDGINDSAELRRGSDPGADRLVPSLDGTRSALLAAGLGVALLCVAGGVRWYRRRATVDPDDDARADVGIETWAETDDEPVPSDDEGAPPEVETDDAGASRSTDAVSVVTNADRIERLLDEHGGRMRQADIVDALDWSKSKVSRVLSSMVEEGRVRKIRLGRENLIVLPGCEPEGVASPR